jgi:4,5-dihydroxyphthalate decarboxylase
VARLLDPAVSRYPLPWLASYAQQLRDEFDGDPFPYGIEPNRPTFELLLRYAAQQGIAHAEVGVDEVFPPGIMTKVIV